MKIIKVQDGDFIRIQKNGDPVLYYGDAGFQYSREDLDSVTWRTFKLTTIKSSCFISHKGLLYQYVEDNYGNNTVYFYFEPTGCVGDYCEDY